MSLSRQREYQLRKMAKGLCGICGKRKLFNSSHCKICREAKLLRQNPGRKRRYKTAYTRRVK